MHAQELKELKNTSEHLSRSLDSIQHNLLHIKYAAIGVAVGLFAKEIGITNLMKLFLN